jgi:hypothetical protein
MKKLLAASVALVAGIVVAAPLVAWSADDNRPQSETASPAPPQGMGRMAMPGMEPGMHRGAGMMENMHDHAGRMFAGPEHGRRSMMHRIMQMPPQQRCEERLARRAAHVAYTVTKLKLTSEQQPLWDKIAAALKTARDKELQFCATLKPKQQRTDETILDRTERLEQYLSMRLQTVQQVRPLLGQLYQALNPEQKTVIDRSMRHG